MMKHGLRYTRLYRIWLNMKNRCYNNRSLPFEYYGGKGVNVCEEWRNDFKAFYDWAMENGYADNLTIDRIDTNGNYEPSNCRWVTMKKQNSNRMSNVNVTWNGKTKNLTEWSLELNIPQKTLNWRYRHWPLDKAFTTKVKGRADEI